MSLAAIRDGLTGWRRQRRQAEIVADDHSFTLESRGKTVNVRWDTVAEVVAFKRDLLTTDLICLLIRTDDASLELNEEMIGYERWEEIMHRRLGISVLWKMEVIAPAFDPRPTRLYPGPFQPLSDGVL